MKAMVLKEYGVSAQFSQQEVVMPEAKQGHVVVKVIASSVNVVDTMIHQMGKDLPLSPNLPAILGMDFAGVVTQVGESVTNFSVGDEVYGCAGGLADLQGALAQYILADAQLIAHKPKTLSMRQAAALPLVGITAYEGLERAGVNTAKNVEEKVLVHGGTGGVGHIAVQLAKYFGADVYATVSTEKQADIVRAYEATPINYKIESVADYVNRYTDGKGFEVIYDSVGNQNLLNSFEAAALNAQVVSTTTLTELELSGAHMKGLSLHIVFMLIPMLFNHNRQMHGDILQQIAEIVDSGNLIPLVDEQKFAFTQVNEAYAHLTSGKAMGKVVIEIE